MQADLPVIGELLHHMRRPARDPAHDENSREHGDFKSHEITSRSGPEIEIGVNPFFRNHGLIENAAHLPIVFRLVSSDGVDHFL